MKRIEWQKGQVQSDIAPATLEDWGKLSPDVQRQWAELEGRLSELSDGAQRSGARTPGIRGATADRQGPA